MGRKILAHSQSMLMGSRHAETRGNVIGCPQRPLARHPRLPRRLFHAIAQEFGKECELLTVWKDREMLSGVLSILSEEQILPCYGGALRRAVQYAVNDFMYWELMCHPPRAGHAVHRLVDRRAARARGRDSAERSGPPARLGRPIPFRPGRGNLSAAPLSLAPSQIDPVSLGRCQRNVRGFLDRQSNVSRRRLGA